MLEWRAAKRDHQPGNNSRYFDERINFHRGCEYGVRIGFGEFGGFGGVVHGAKLGTTHGTEGGVFEAFFGKGFVVHGLGGFGVQRKGELFAPIEVEAGAGEFVVAVTGTFTVAGDVGSVGGDLIGDDALLYIFPIRQAEVLFGSDVAEHGCAIPTDHGRADGGGNVVVAGSDVGDERAEGVERRFVAHLFFFFDLEGNLVERDVARAFDHDLDVVLPSFLG